MSYCKMDPKAVKGIKDIFGIDFIPTDKYKGQKYGSYLYYYAQILDTFFLVYIKNNNLKDSTDGRKFNFDENLINFFKLLIEISNDRRIPLVLDGNFFYFQDCFTLFKLCVIMDNESNSQDLTIYDFTETTKLEKRLKYKLSIENNNDDDDSY